MVGWREYACVLRRSRDHLFSETHEADRVAGMSRLRNTVTRRYDVRHRVRRRFGARCGLLSRIPVLEMFATGSKPDSFNTWGSCPAIKGRAIRAEKLLQEGRKAVISSPDLENLQGREW